MFTVLLPKGILASFYLNTMEHRNGMWYVTGTYNGGTIRATMSCFMSPDDTPDGFGYCCVSSFTGAKAISLVQFWYSQKLPLYNNIKIV